MKLCPWCVSLYHFFFFFSFFLSEPFSVHDWSDLTTGPTQSHLHFTSTLLGTRCFVLLHTVKKNKILPIIKKIKENSIMLDQVRGKCFVHFVKHSAVAYPYVLCYFWLNIRSTPSSSCSTSQSQIESIYDVTQLSMLCGICTKNYFMLIFFPCRFFDKDHLFCIIFICIKHSWSTLPAVSPGMFLVFLFFWCNIKIHNELWKSSPPPVASLKCHYHCMKVHRHLMTCFILVYCFPFKVSFEMPNIFFDLSVK